MPAIKKTIHFAFERGERVWMVCDPAASGTIDGYTLREGYLPRYIVAFPNGASTHSDHELTREQPNPFLESLDLPARKQKRGRRPVHSRSPLRGLRRCIGTLTQWAQLSKINRVGKT